jgi:uncharacterized membrane protein
MNGTEHVVQPLDPAASDEALLRTLRARRRQKRQAKQRELPLTLGQTVADRVAATMGSWPFIIVQSIIFAAWVALNVAAYAYRWDPYPFILLNLALSFQAAYAAPIIMMSQNRQQDIDRQAAADDYQINVKAELEIELLHQKLDDLREIEVLQLTKTVQKLSTLLEEAINRAQERATPETHVGG